MIWKDKNIMNSGYTAKNIIRYLAMNWNNYSNESS